MHHRPKRLSRPSLRPLLDAEVAGESELSEDYDPYPHLRNEGFDEAQIYANASDEVGYNEAPLTNLFQR